MTSEDNVIHEKAILISKNFKKTEIELIDILQLVMKRKIYLSLGFGSMFEYATGPLALRESNAYAYTKIAKTAVAIPELKMEIEKGSLSITNARRIAPALTQENKSDLIQKATTLSSRALEKVVAEIHPESVRESVRAVSENRSSLKLGISEEILQKLKRAQVILSNQRRKNVSLEEVLEASLTQFLEKNDPIQKAARAKAADLVALPNSDGIDTLSEKPNGMVTVANQRQTSVKRTPIPAGIKHQVFQRDLGNCAYRRTDGTKCGSQHFIEIHHKIPVSRGGTNAIENLITLCSSHHRHHHESAPSLTLGRNPGDFRQPLKI